MDSFIKQIAKKAGLSEDLARSVLETAREYLQQTMAPEDFARVEETLSDERKAKRAGRLFARFERKAKGLAGSDEAERAE